VGKQGSPSMPEDLDHICYTRNEPQVAGSAILAPIKATRYTHDQDLKCVLSLRSDIALTKRVPRMRSV